MFMDKYAKQMFFVSEDLAEIATYTNAPLATYVHNANKEISISAVDTTADTLTSVAHGLSNGNILYPVMAYGTAKCYLKDKLPGGISNMNYPGYYVVSKTDDTFQLSLTSGGAAIDITPNANIDFTSFVFVHNNSTNFGVQISGLPNLQKCIVKIHGRSYRKDNSFTVLPVGITNGAIWFRGSYATYVNHAYSKSGDLGFNLEVIIDTQKYAMIKNLGLLCASNTTTNNTITSVNDSFMTLDFKEITFNSIICDLALANGSIVEVFRA